MAFLNEVIPSPKDLPREGSFLGPKMRSAITMMTIISGNPSCPNIPDLQDLIEAKQARQKKCQPTCIIGTNSAGSVKTSEACDYFLALAAASSAFFWSAAAFFSAD